MELNDYKRVMGGVTAPDAMKEKIIRNCESGREPRQLAAKTKNSTVMRRVLLIAATVAVIACVIAAWALIVRFVGPAGADNPVDETTGTVSGVEKVPVGITVLSCSTDLAGVTVKVKSFDAKTQTVTLEWKNDSRYKLVLGKSYGLYKQINGEWTGSCFEKQVMFNSIAMLYESGRSYDKKYNLSQWSDNITAGTYRIEEAFYGGDENGNKLTFDFTLDSKESDNSSSDITLIQSSSDFEGINMDIVSYDAKTKQLTVKWVNNTETNGVLGKHYTMYQQKNVIWAAMSLNDGVTVEDVSIELHAGKSVQMTYKIGEDYLAIGDGTYRLTAKFWLNAPDATGYDMSESKAKNAVLDFVIGNGQNADADDVTLLAVTFSDNNDGFVANGNYVGITAVGYDKNTGMLKLNWSVSGAQVTVFCPFSLNRYENNKWVEASADVDFIEIARILTPETNNTVEYNLGVYGSITDGRYRLTTDFVILGETVTLNAVFRIGGQPVRGTDPGFELVSEVGAPSGLALNITDYDPETLTLRVSWKNGTSELFTMSAGSFSLYRQTETQDSYGLTSWTSDGFRDLTQFAAVPDAFPMNAGADGNFSINLGKAANRLPAGVYKLCYKVGSYDIEMIFRLTVDASSAAASKNVADNYSSATGINGLTLKIDRYDTAEKKLWVTWMNDSGATVAVSEDISLYKSVGNRYTQDCFEKRGSIEATDGMKLLHSGTATAMSYDLGRWSDNISYGSYRFTVRVGDKEVSKSFDILTEPEQN